VSILADSSVPFNDAVLAQSPIAVA